MDNQVEPLTHENLSSYQALEFIMIIGPAGTGKSYSILSLADIWSRFSPDGIIYIIDIETGIAKTWQRAFQYVGNIKLWHGEQVDDSDKFLEVFSSVIKLVTPRDWLCLESDTRIWDMAQDTAWLKVTGRKKDEYLSGIIGSNKPVTPHPDQLWQFALDAYRRKFRDVLNNKVRLKTNVLITTGITKNQPKVSAARKETMKLLNIDISPDGHAENTRNPDTVILLRRDIDGYWAEVLKDRANDKPGQMISFKVDSFYLDFYLNCRKEVDSEKEKRIGVGL